MSIVIATLSDIDARCMAARRTEHGCDPGTYRRVVDRIPALLRDFCCTRIGFARHAGIHGAFPGLGCRPICRMTLRRAERP